MCALSNSCWKSIVLGPCSSFNGTRIVTRWINRKIKSLCALPFSRSRMFVLQQVPVYLTPERASKLAIVSAHRREEPALNGGGGGGGDGGVGVDVSVAETSQRQQKPLGEGDVDLIPALAGIHDERSHELVKSSSLPVFGRLSTYLLRGWPFSGGTNISRAAAFVRQAYLFHQRAESKNIDTSMVLFKAKRLFCLCSQSSVRAVSVTRSCRDHRTIQDGYTDNELWTFFVESSFFFNRGFFDKICNFAEISEKIYMYCKY